MKHKSTFQKLVAIFLSTVLFGILKHKIWMLFFILFFSASLNIILGQDSWSKPTFFSKNGSLGGNAQVWGSLFAMPDAFGNVYRTGTFQDTIFFSINQQKVALASKGNTDVFIEKLDPLGNTIWVKQLGGIGFDDVNGIELAANSAFVNITFSDTMVIENQQGNLINIISESETDVAILELDFLGKLKNKILLQGNGKNGCAFTIDQNNDVYIAAYFVTDVTIITPLQQMSFFDDTAEVSTIILKIDNAGSIVWNNPIVGNGTAYIGAIKVDKERVLVSGWIKGRFKIFTHNAVYNVASKPPASVVATGNQLGYITSIDTLDGQIKWIKTLGSMSEDASNCFPRVLTTNNNSEIFIGGFYSGEVTGYLSKPTHSFYSSFILKLSREGNFNWSRKIGGKAFWTDVTSLYSDKSNQLWITGLFDANLEFEGTNQFAQLQHHDAGSELDGYLAIYNNEGGIVSIKKTGTSSFDFTNCVVGDKNGNVFLSGISSNNFEIAFANSIQKVSLANPQLYIYTFKFATESLSLLPIGLQKFNVSCASNNYFIRWSTNYEINSDYFDIEQSIDGISFQKVATKKAKEYSSISQEYDYSLQKPINRKVFFRLKLVDKDGLYIYSSTQSSVCDLAFETIAISPNPTKNNININLHGLFISSLDKIHITIFDVYGKMVTQKDCASQNAAIQLNVNHLSKGIYYIHVKTNNIYEIKKFIKE